MFYFRRDVSSYKYLLSSRKDCIKAGPFGSQLKNSELDDDGEYKVYNQRTVLDRNFTNGTDFINQDKFDSLKDFEIFAKDILLTTRGTIGRCIEVPNGIQRGVLHPCLIKLNLNNDLILNLWLIKYFNESSYFKENVLLNSNATTIEVIYTYTLRDVFIPLPPIHEQKSITSYLDHKTSQIDSLISKKKQMIDLLKEERAAIINHAVTKGINPDAEMKDSGVEWLGEVSKHWKVCKLKHTIEVKDGTHSTPAQVECSEDSIPLITSKNIKNGKVDFEDTTFISKKDYLEINKRSNVAKNDIIMPMIGTVGNPAIVTTERLFSIKNVALFKSSPTADMRFIQYLFNSVVITTQFDFKSTGGVQSFVSLSILNNLLFFNVNLQEQKAIANYLDQKTTQIDSSITHIEKEISLIEEYRTALINETVTGKIDIREKVKG